MSDEDFWKNLAEDRLLQIQDLQERITETTKWLHLYRGQLEMLKLNIEGDIDLLESE